MKKIKSLPAYTIGIPIYNGVDLLDIAAPREIFHWTKERLRKSGRGILNVYFIGSDSGEVIKTLDGTKLIPDRSFSDSDVQNLTAIWVPGSDIWPVDSDTLSKYTEIPLFKYIREAGGRAKYICSVCEGALLLAHAGLLNGFKATTHWEFYPCMEVFPEVKLVPPKKENGGLSYPRYIHDSNRLTGGGVSSGIDEAFYLVSLLFGQELANEIQKITQYFPNPPVNAKIEQPTTCCPLKNWGDNPNPCD